MSDDEPVLLSPLATLTLGMRYQGQVIMSSSWKVDTAWRCPHRHKYKDCAIHCAGVQSRRMQKGKA